MSLGWILSCCKIANALIEERIRNEKSPGGVERFRGWNLNCCQRSFAQDFAAAAGERCGKGGVAGAGQSYGPGAIGL
jgi:hypothetical protein